MNMMAYDYIRRTYGVDPKPKQRVLIDGKWATIVLPRGDPHYLRVRFDGQKHTSNAHPTWRIEYGNAALAAE